jgi:hypothetical protein
MTRRLLLRVCLLAAAGCGILFSGEERVIGRLDTDGLDEFLEAPDTVAPGTTFIVTVITSGDGCDRMGDTESRVSGLVAEITPYDFRQVDENCTSIGARFTHRVPLAFETVGRGRVIVKARDLFGDPVQFEREVWVQ